MLDFSIIFIRHLSANHFQIFPWIVLIIFKFFQVFFTGCFDVEMFGHAKGCRGGLDFKGFD